MSIEQKSGLPFLNTFPVHTQIRIQPHDREYVAYVQSGWAKWHRFHIGLRQQDIQDLNSELQQTIEQISGSLTVKSDGSADQTRALSTLAHKGNFAFKRIFAEGIPRTTIRNALNKGAIIQVSSEDFFIPWELLYDGPLSSVNISDFWGMQYIVSRALIQDARPGDFVSPVIKAPRPRIGVIACNQLQHVLSHEIPALEDLRKQKRISLSLLRPLNADDHYQELSEVGKFLSKKLEVTHLACHAYTKQPVSQSYLLISDDFTITIEDIRVQEFEIKHNPLVILNACLTGTINPLSTSNWASLFWERGARGVLATEFRVPDWFAASFVIELYQHLLSGKSIGVGLLATRHHFWEQHSNPLGLAYALYSSPSIRIITTGRKI